MWCVRVGVSNVSHKNKFSLFSGVNKKLAVEMFAGPLQHIQPAMCGINIYKQQVITVSIARGKQIKGMIHKDNASHLFRLSRSRTFDLPKCHLCRQLCSVYFGRTSSRICEHLLKWNTVLRTEKLNNKSFVFLCKPGQSVLEYLKQTWSYKRKVYFWCFQTHIV